jgi:hypothetical protein
MKNRSELPALFQQHYQIGFGCEVGTQDGNFAEEIKKTYQGFMYVVDFWQDENWFQAVNERLRDGFAPLRMSSAEASNFVEDGSLDFVYIDAGHDYANIKQDLDKWYPKVRSGGIVSGHDYRDGTNKNGEVFGVKQAVDELVAKLNIKLETTTDDVWTDGEYYNSWYFVK